MADYNSVHTGQEIDSAITAVQNKESTWDGKLDASQKGAAGGVASLGSDGKVPSGQLPEMDYVPTSRKVNGKALTADITLAAGDVGAVPTSRTVNGKALSANVTLAASDVGAVPTSRTVNGKALSSNITLTADDVSAIPSSQKGVASGVATLGSDGKVPASQLNASGGKRVARFTVGTSASGWTSADCDYLCDGTADQVEINAAIQALPSTGGEIVILDGTYNITATIAMNKANVKLSGNGASTVLKRMWNSTSVNGVITVSSTLCAIESLFVYGGGTTNTLESGIYVSYSYTKNTITGNICTNNYIGIRLDGSSSTVTDNTCYNNNHAIYATGDNNTITGNTCSNNVGHGIYSLGDNSAITGNTCNNNDYGIYLHNSDNNTITGNTCHNNNNGVRMYNSDNNTITGNICNNNDYGIYMDGSSNHTITGNACIRGGGGSDDYTSSQHTIYLYSTRNDNNLIAYNNIMGKNYTSGGGTGNTFEGNKYN